MRGPADGPPLALRACGLAAILGDVLNVVADHMLRGGPAPCSAAEITFESLGSVPTGIVFTGGVLGAAAIPLWLFGLVPVFAALAPAGRLLALIPVVTTAYGIAVASGSHGAYALYAEGYRALGSVGSEADPVLTIMMDRFMDYDRSIVAIIAASWMIGSLAFVVIVLLCPTHYRRWMAFLSPILVPLAMPLGAALPAPIGGYVRPILGTTIRTSFFVMATVLTWSAPGNRVDSILPGADCGPSRRGSQIERSRIRRYRSR